MPCCVIFLLAKAKIKATDCLLLLLSSDQVEEDGRVPIKTNCYGEEARWHLAIFYIKRLCTKECWKMERPSKVVDLDLSLLHTDCNNSFVVMHLSGLYSWRIEAILVISTTKYSAAAFLLISRGSSLNVVIPSSAHVVVSFTLLKQLGQH